MQAGVGNGRKRERAEVESVRGRRRSRRRCSLFARPSQTSSSPGLLSLEAPELWRRRSLQRVTNVLTLLSASHPMPPRGDRCAGPSAAARAAVLAAAASASSTAGNNASAFGAAPALSSGFVGLGFGGYVFRVPVLIWTRSISQAQRQPERRRLSPFDRRTKKT